MRALRARLPQESLLYVGDSARVPYGPKSPETVRRYALQIGEWLTNNGVKMVVVACNTATAHALDVLERTLPVPVIGVVAPGARAAVRASRSGRVGVIGTAGTIGSRAYERAMHDLVPDLQVHSQACPLFVPLVEEGWTDHPATKLIAREYLAPLAASDIDALVLGCTHYPLLAGVIAEVLGPAVALIDSAAETAAETAARLEFSAQLASGQRKATLRVLATDAPDRFFALGRRLLDDSLTAVDHVTFT